MATAVWSAAIFTAGFLFAARRMQIGLALLLAVVCWYGALHRLDARPATVAIAFPPLLLLLLRSDRRLAVRLVLLAGLSAIWVNVHPSALLAPAIAALFLLGGATTRRDVSVAGASTGASLAGLLLNPHGVGAITAPLHLVRTIGSKAYVNTEWLPSPLGLFPLLYIAAAAGGIVLILKWHRERDGGPLLVFVLLAALAIRGVRNQDLFFAAVPFLTAAKLGALLPPLPARMQRLAMAAAAAVLALSVLNGVARAGLDHSVFPVSAVAQLQASGLKGNVYNPDQLGGYLAWSFYPHRRHLVDGRHELFDGYLAEYAEARLDSRKWAALLRRYDVTLAVDEYRNEPMTVIDPQTGGQRPSPASLVYFPRERWALIGFDDVSMVFARRDAHPEAALREVEYRMLVPDGPELMRSLRGEKRARAAEELRRAEMTVEGGTRVLRQMLAAVN